MSNIENSSLRKLMLASALSLLTIGAVATDAAAQTGQRAGTQRMVVDDFAIADDWGSRIQPNWAQYSQSLQREFNRLTPDDISRSNGGRAEVVSAIMDRYNLSNERASDRLTAWQRRQR